MERILIIDDEIQIRRLLEITLQSKGYAISAAETGGDGLVQAAMHRPDLVVLDLGLPDTDGINVLKELRKWSTMPVIILSVRNTEDDIIAALDAGADDYLTKPFSSGELLARVRTALRHADHKTEETEFRCGDIEVNFAAHTVKKHGEILKLTSTEFDLLVLLVKNRGKVLTHKFMLEQVWGHAYAEETQYTRVYVAQLRKKLEDDPGNPKYVITESGIGYRFNL